MTLSDMPKGGKSKRHGGCHTPISFDLQALCAGSWRRWYRIGTMR